MLASARAKWLVAGLVAAIAAGVAGYFLFVKSPGDVSNGDRVEFQSEPAPPPKPKKVRLDRFRWPVYGWDNQHTRFFPSRLEPPFRRVWKHDGQDTLEISPILIDGTLYVMNKRATLRAISARTGKLKWRKHLGSLSAGAPAYAHGRLFVTTLSQKAFAVDPKRRGKIMWRIKLPSRSESSPIVVGKRVYFGSEDGTVYSVGWQKGIVRWRFRASGAVKGAVAYWRGRIYFGAYGGRMYCVSAKTGRLIWSQSTAGLALGRSGNFYATPTVAFGRVYIGNTDGRVYSFSAKDGRLAWTHSTGNYVYAAAAAADTKRTPPTIYVGSYDRNFYALDARTGRVRWTYPAGERISGAPTVVGGVVYFSTLIGFKTFGLKVTTGKRVFLLKRGDYNPAIASPDALYITAVNFIFKYVPATQGKGGAKKPAKKAKKPAKKKG